MRMLVDFDEPERLRLQVAAKAAGVPMKAFIRRATMAALDPAPDDLRDCVLEIRDTVRALAAKRTAGRTTPPTIPLPAASCEAGKPSASQNPPNPALADAIAGLIAFGMPPAEATTKARGAASTNPAADAATLIRLSLNGKGKL